MYADVAELGLLRVLLLRATEGDTKVGAGQSQNRGLTTKSVRPLHVTSSCQEKGNAIGGDWPARFSSMVTRRRIVTSQNDGGPMSRFQIVEGPMFPQRMGGSESC